MPQDVSNLIERRRELLGPNLPTFYDEPVHLVKGEGVWLWDADGKKYLDCYNNVPHVGHCHPAVVEAIARQAATLNTHTRYLHETILEYVERLTGHFGEGLSTAIMTCTGSEANDIALRMAQAAILAKRDEQGSNTNKVDADDKTGSNDEKGIAEKKALKFTLLFEPTIHAY